MNIFAELSLIIVIATVIAGVMRILKQPLIMGHILTGILVGPYFLGIFIHKETVEVFSQLGISILLFIVGLSLSPKIVKEVGKISLITGLGQIVFTTFFGFLIALAFGYSLVSSLYIALALTFSSTIITLKLLSDKKDVEKLYGRIVIGLLLVQDLVATIILIVVSTFAGGDNAGLEILFIALKGLAVWILFSIVSSKFLPKLSSFFAKSQEYLFLFSIGWGFGMASLFNLLGFSVEIGALVAGVTLSVSPFAQEMSNKLKPLRDFFLIMFFVLLGSTLEVSNLGSFIVPAIVFSLFVLIVKPMIIVIITGMQGFNKKTSFNSGLTVAQISEFSLILVLLGLKLGHINQQIVSLVTFVGVVTIAVSSYLILYSDKIYPYFAGYLSIFERKKTIKEVESIGIYEVILFWCNRVGYDFIRAFKKLGSSFLAVDFNPEIVSTLREKGVNVKYGDAEDPEFLEELGFESTEIIISTIPDYETNLFLLKKAKAANRNIVVILISYNLEEAIKLYEHQATYVIMPHFIGGQFAAELAKKAHSDNTKLLVEREGHIEYLKERRSLGQAHPRWEHH